MISYLKKIFVLTFLITITFTTLTCKKSPNEPNWFDKFLFTFEDASCTEAWFNLKLKNLSKPVLVNVYRDNFLDKSFNIYTTDDTTFYIENLLPKKSYEVYVEVKPNNEKVYRSNNLRFTTMDTTSHEFTWQSWEFGTTGSSVLYDVAIIDENDIWAVGEINIADTSINGYTTYNAVHWDGTKWELKRINVNFRGNVITPPLEGVFAFSENDIWFVGSLPIHGDGKNWMIYDLRTTLDPNISVSRCWGSNSNDMYFVGRNGNIAHWDGVRWTKIESGTNTMINDIYGYKKNKKELYEILCAISEKFGWGEQKILTIVSNINNIDSIPIGIVSYPQSIWSYNGLIKYACGNGVFVNNYGEWKEILEENIYFTNRIRGNNYNDIILIGGYGLVIHFNGISFNRYEELLSSYVSYKSLSIKNGLVVIVGIYGNKAIITIGKI